MSIGITKIVFLICLKKDKLEMKSDEYQRRFYRAWIRGRDLYSAQMVIKDTSLQIRTNKPIERHFLEEKLAFYRWQIENYISRENRFLTSLKPIAVELGAPLIVKKMAQAARKANVGPMASVAGAIAQFLGRDLLLSGYKDVIIENGGDIFLKITKTRLVGIYAGRANLWNKIKLKIKPGDTPMGICTSSGTIGHSLSFGCADSVVILSKNTALADAVATACANLVQAEDQLNNGLDFARSIKGILGAVIILKRQLVSWGNVEFV